MDLPKIAIFIAFFALVALAFEIFFFRKKRALDGSEVKPQETALPVQSSSSKRKLIIVGIVLLVVLLPIGLLAVYQQVRTQNQAAPSQETLAEKQIACDQIDTLRNNALVGQGTTLSTDNIVSFSGYCYTTAGSLTKLKFSLTSPTNKVTTAEYLAFSSPQKDKENKHYFQATYPHVKLLEAGSYIIQIFAYNNESGFSKDPFKKTFIVASSTTVPQSPTPTLAKLPETGSANLAPTCTSLSAIPLTGPAPLTVSFTGSGNDSDGQVSAFEFTFGDGAKQSVNKTPAPSSSASTSHAYQASGNYTASLRVQDNNGNFSNVAALCSVQIAVATGISSTSASLKAQPTKTISPTPTPATLPEAGISLPMVGFVTGGLLLFTLGLLLIF